MIEEIIYTSAQKGLKAGSRGFCTVVSTAGMALNTAERLESMSGYRHAFPMHDPRAQHNPVNYSHVTLRIGGKNTHVISRISDAGQDYSGRTNKLAHHLMFDDVSRLVVGPARLMAENGVFATQWDGNVRNVPPRNLSTPAMPKSVELKAWKTVTGDSGWAGWVAEHLMKDKAPVSVIFAAGTDTLTLVREVLDLLPPTQRWGVTFSTYFTKLLAGTECQLRFVLDDTPEVTSLRNDARAKVVDLTKGLSAAQGGLLVEQARTGRVQFGNSDVPEPRVPNRSQPQVQAEPLRQVIPAPGRNEESAGSGSLPEIPMLNARAPAIPFGSRTGPPELFVEPIHKRRRWTWILYALGSLLLMVVASGVTFFVVTKMNGGPPGQVEAPVVVSSDSKITKGAHRVEIPKSLDNAASVDQQKTETGSNKVTNAGEAKSDAKQRDQSSNSTGTTEATPPPEIAEVPPPETTLSDDAPPMQESTVQTESPPPKEEPGELADPFSVARSMKEHVDDRKALHFELPDPNVADSVEFPLDIQGTQGVQVEVLNSFFGDLVVDNGLNDLTVSYISKGDQINWDVTLLHGKEQDVLGVLQLMKSNNDPKRTHVLRFTWNVTAKEARNAPGVALVKWSPITVKVGEHLEAMLLSRPYEMAGPTASGWLTEAGGGHLTEEGPNNPFGDLAAKNFKSLRCRILIRHPDKQVCSIDVAADDKKGPHFWSMHPSMEQAAEKISVSTQYLVQFEPRLKINDKMSFELDMKCRILCRAFGMLGDEELQSQIKKPLDVTNYVHRFELPERFADLQSRLETVHQLIKADTWSEFELCSDPDPKKEVKEQSELLGKLEKHFQTLKDALLASEAARKNLLQQPDESMKAMANEKVDYFKARAAEVKAMEPIVEALLKEIDDDHVSAVKDKIRNLNEYMKDSKVKLELYVPISTPSKSKTIEVHFLTSTWN